MSSHKQQKHRNQKPWQAHIRGNGNGELTVSKLVTIVTLVIMVLSPIVSVAVLGASIKRDVAELKELVPKNTERINDLTSEQVRVETTLEIMGNDVKEIKQDVKLLLRGG